MIWIGVIIWSIIIFFTTSFYYKKRSVKDSDIIIDYLLSQVQNYKNDRSEYRINEIETQLYILKDNMKGK